MPRREPGDGCRHRGLRRTRDAASGRAWRTARAESGGWEAPGFDDREWTRAVERRSSPAPENDQANALAVARLLAALAHEHGTAVVCATHDPIALAFADEEIALGGAASHTLDPVPAAG